eukprot:TRINITY_DN6836_c0_g1_i1.p1 TRINITY_DN6836_c0_g1~~TRINITY_DN6836_c0_g1_i1.p1  ORF type:complete len:225 (-),score=74.08 TRINITY_DN6836_c0_g1_i1:38-712(-)
MSADIPPNQTLYVNKLNEKIKVDELKKSLHAAFSRFGAITDIVAMKTYKARGQAWIVFTDISAATNALREMQNFSFYDQPIQVTYAKSKSDAIAKLDGTYVEVRRSEKRKAEGEVQKKAAKKAPKEGGAKKEKFERVEGNLQPRQNPPNKILFVENLGNDVTDVMLQTLFEQFPGFKEVRVVPGKKGIAFIEYENEVQATVAMDGLQHFKITQDQPMVVSYGKR